MMNERISEKLNYPSKFADVLGSKMHYIEEGEGDPILLLHGIPTSNYLWRNIIPYLSPLGRCIAPDLIGFGRSDKPDIEYSVFDHIHYLEKFIETLHLKKITFVLHGWGSVIGFSYAMKHENNCMGLVFYEAFLRSFNHHDVSLPYEEQLIALQEESHINNLMMEGASYVDKILQQSVVRQLTAEEMNQYKKPFLKEGSGKPILQYIKELPHLQGKGEINQLINEYTEKLSRSKLPKLMLYSVPGFITTIATVMWAKDHLPNLEIVDIGEELHLAQESNPELVGETISVWLQSVEQMRG